MAYVQGESLKASAALLTEAFKLPDHQVGGMMIQLVYITAAALPAFLIFYGRAGKAWAFGAWAVGLGTAVVAIMMNAFAMAPGNPTAQAALAGEAFPLAFMMPLAAIWAARRLRSKR